MTSSSALCEIDFLFALVDLYIPQDAAGGEPELVQDMVKLGFAVHPDDTWNFTVGRHPALFPGVDSTLHTITGDADTSASDLLRRLAERIIAPHEVAADH